MLEHLPKSVGHLLKGQRSGLSALAMHQIHGATVGAQIEVYSSAFHDHEAIPARFTADGEGLSPPLVWRGIPEGARSVVLVVEDADAPTPEPFVHAIVVDLPAQDSGLAEGALGRQGGEPEAPHVAKMGRNSLLRAEWLPPDPPPGHGVHRYAFQVFALEGGAMSGHFTGGSPGRDAVLEVLQRHAIASGCVIGTYERQE